MALTIDSDACESSGVCVMVCPEDVLEIREGKPVIINRLACTSCWICVENCTAGAIDID